MESLNEKKMAVKLFGTKNYRLFIRDDIVKAAEYIQNTLATTMQEFERSGSGWSLGELLHIKVNIAKLKPMCAGCHIDLPKDISA